MLRACHRGWFRCLPQRGTPAVVWEEEEEAPGRANEKLIVHMQCNAYCLAWLSVACLRS